MVCVERVTEYSQLQSESPLTTDSDGKLSSLWPEVGNIEVSNLAVRYRDTLPLSLRGVSFTIKQGQRIGVVGRTGKFAYFVVFLFVFIAPHFEH